MDQKQCPCGRDDCCQGIPLSLREARLCAKRLETRDGYASWVIEELCDRIEHMESKDE